MKRITLFIIGLFFLFTLSARQVQRAAGQELLRENFSQTYPLAPNGRVSVGNIAGDIRINAWDRNEVKVEAVKMAYTQERLSEARIEVDAGTDAVRIRTKYPDRNMNFSYGKGDDKNKRDSAALVDYTLTVPRNATLSDVNSVSGDITLEGVTGELKISSVSGDVKAKGLSSNNVRLSSVSGAVDVAMTRTANGQDIQLSSVSGMVILVLPSDAHANVRANTVSGLVRNTFGLPVRVGQYVGRDFAGQLGSGGARIKLNTVSGSVELRRADDGKTPSVVTNLLPEGDDARAADAEAQADFADLQRAHEQALKEAEKSLKEVEKEFEKAQKKYDEERQRYEEAQRSSDEATRNRAQERYEEVRDEYRDAQREFRNAEREFRNVQREHERTMRDAQREQQRARVTAAREAARASAEAAREASRASAEATREAARASAEAAGGVSGGIYVGSHGPLLTERDERTINLNGTPVFNLYTDDGAIVVRAWDNPQVKVVFVKRGRDQADLNVFNLTAQQNGSNVEIRAEVDKAKQKQSNRGSYYEGSVGLEVWLPRNVKLLKAHTGDGRILLEGVAGEIDLNTGDGSVDVLRSGGRIKVNTGDGRINVSDFKGAANVRTGDGRIALNGQFEELSAETGDGNITYTYTNNLNAVIEAECENIVANGSFSGVDNAPGKKKVTIGSGGKTFRFRTGDGKLFLQRE